MMIYMYGVLIKCEVKIAAICLILFLNTAFMDPDWDEVLTHAQKEMLSTGSQSQCRIQFGFPTHWASHIIKWLLKYWYLSLTGFTCFKSLSRSSAGVPRFSFSISSIKLCFFSPSSFNLSYRVTENTIEKHTLKQMHIISWIQCSTQKILQTN